MIYISFNTLFWKNKTGGYKRAIKTIINNYILRILHAKSLLSVLFLFASIKSLLKSETFECSPNLKNEGSYASFDPVVFFSRPDQRKCVQELRVSSMYVCVGQVYRSSWIEWSFSRRNSSDRVHLKSNETGIKRGARVAGQ